MTEILADFVTYPAKLPEEEQVLKQQAEGRTRC